MPARTVPRCGTIDQAALDDKERAAIRAAARLLRERFAAVEVVLFGSRARGEGDAESDLDLLVLTARPLRWRERHALIDALFGWRSPAMWC